MLGHSPTFAAAEKRVRRDNEMQKPLQGEQAIWGKIVWQNTLIQCTCFNWKHQDGTRRSSVQGRWLLIGGSQVHAVMTLLSLLEHSIITASMPLMHGGRTKS